MDAWVTVATFMNGLEANVAKGKLESEGIETSLADEEVVQMNWLWSNAVGGVKVRVRPADLERARDLLENPMVDAAELEEAAMRDAPAKVLPLPRPEAPSRCPFCGSERFTVSRFLNPIAAFIGLIFMGAPAPVRSKRRRCSDCGKWR